MTWFPILLVIHIGLAIGLLLPSVLLPFVLRRTRGKPAPFIRALMAMQGTGTLMVGAGLAVVRSPAAEAGGPSRRRFPRR